MLLLLATHALAAPTYAAMVGGGMIGGESAGQGYASWSPVVAGSVDWRFAWVEVWVGLSGTGFLALDGKQNEVPAALLQGEFGVGLGSPTASAGVYLGAGLSGGEGGFYGRFSLPGPSWASRLGGELRAFHLGQFDATGFVLMARAEFGEGSSKRPPPPPRHHEAPYGD
jgi:hypothetical protein